MTTIPISFPKNNNHLFIKDCVKTSAIIITIGIVATAAILSPVFIPAVAAALGSTFAITLLVTGLLPSAVAVRALAVVILDTSVKIIENNKKRSSAPSKQPAHVPSPSAVPQVSPKSREKRADPSVAISSKFDGNKTLAQALLTALQTNSSDIAQHFVAFVNDSFERPFPISTKEPPVLIGQMFYEIFTQNFEKMPTLSDVEKENLVKFGISVEEQKELYINHQILIDLINRGTNIEFTYSHEGIKQYTKSTGTKIDGPALITLLKALPKDPIAKCCLTQLIPFPFQNWINFGIIENAGFTGDGSTFGYVFKLINTGVNFNVISETEIDVTLPINYEIKKLPSGDSFNSFSFSIKYKMKKTDITWDYSHFQAFLSQPKP
jgi:hypothetical protein